MITKALALNTEAKYTGKTWDGRDLSDAVLRVPVFLS